MKWRMYALAAAGLALAACQGDKGTAGPPGTEGSPGPAGDGYISLEPAGVVGLVKDVGGAAVPGGTVYFVPASAVASMGATTTAIDSDTDEPLEDLIRLHGASYAQAEVQSDGVYRVTSLAAGSYFITFVPQAGAGYLPGGSVCRVARPSDALVGTRLDIEVSASIPSDATYVGSSKCITCHGRAHISGTMHRLGIWSPYRAGPLQDLDARRTDLYLAIDNKFATGQKVYFYERDGNRGFDKYKTSEGVPATAASFSVTLKKDVDGKLSMVLHNEKDLLDLDVEYPVDAVYGGGVNKQRYLTKLGDGNGGFYYTTLPLQFNPTGSEAYSNRTSKVWRDYHGDWWYDETNGKLTKPAASKSFEKNCMSCHAVGVRIDPVSFKPEMVKDADYGDFDFDGDGVAEELNVGCETCHGPGSRHWEAAGRGKHIVALQLLTPEREAMVCGQCHSRPEGKFLTDSPVDEEGRMMLAGTSRNDYLKHQTEKLDNVGLWADEAGATSKGSHSQAHHQQYSDFIRSKLYKNDQELLTCSACHDPHRKTENPRQLRKSASENTALCGSCHPAQASDVVAHIGAKGVPAATAMSAAQCIDCHMPKTAQSGAAQPSGITGQVSGKEYWWNDISSHVFDVPMKAASIATGMPTAYTNPCQTCHGGAGM